MALPPEKISVKRRRDEAPIETFYLEEHARTKRRITTASNQAFQFTLIRTGTIAPVSQQQSPASKSTSTPAAAPSASGSNGIPSIRTTAPGDEDTDFAKFTQEQTTAIRPSNSKSSQDVPQSTAQGQQHPRPIDELLPSARRFHLTRDLSSLQRHSASRPSSSTTSIRPPLPTFTERQPLPGIDPSTGKPQQVSQDHSAVTTEQPNGHSATLASSSTEPPARTGTSLQDPASSWNLDSDTLADELAALAMDLDPELASSVAKEAIPEPPPQPPKPIEGDVEFIYETYMRMPYDAEMHDVDIIREDANVGVLVIDEADEELWQEYMESDEDSEWDEEDSNGV